MSKRSEQAILNKNEYNSNRRRELGLKVVAILVSIEEFDKYTNILNQKGLTREQFIKNIIEKYK
jgi:hypothetical protein